MSPAYINLRLGISLLYNCRYAVLLWLGILNFVLAVAQEDIRFERITVDDGLSQSSITSMIQDKFGYLWIGTLDGLNRYDGKTFTVYRNENRPHSFPSSEVTEIFIDHRERLWVAYRNGLSLYDSKLDNFKNFTVQLYPEQTIFIRDLKSVSDTLMVLCTNHGVFNFNPISGTTVASPEFRDFSGRGVASIFEFRGMTWLASDSSIWRKREMAQSWEKFYGDNRLRSAFFKTSNELYIRTESKVWKYDTLSDQLKLLTELSSKQWPISDLIYKTTNGQLWVAHGEITVFDHDDRIVQRLRHVSNNPNSLSGAFVSEIYETKDGVIWVGTNGLGLNKYDPYRSTFSHIGHFPGAEVTLSDSYVYSIYEDGESNLIVSTLEGLNLISLQERKSLQMQIRDKDGQEVHALKIIKDLKGHVWLGTSKGLRSLFNNTIRYSGNKLLDDPELRIYDIVNWNNSSLLLATNQSILFFDIEKDNAEVLHHLGSEVIQRVNDHYWFESSGRIHVHELKTRSAIKIFPANGSDSLRAPLASVKCIFQDSNHRIWIGTNGGGISLYSSESETFRHFTSREGLVNNVVYGILEDESGFLWLSTNKGISVFDPSSFSFVRHFNKSDGLQSNEFNTRAFFKSASGKMYFGGVNGLTIFDPQQALRIPTLLPKTIITGFYINNIRQDQEGNPEITRLFSEQKVELNWNQRNFSCDIAGLGFTFPSGIRYMYKLEGYDQNWNMLENHDRITYTNMNSGTYTLRVKSGNYAGLWEDPGLNIEIRIVSPFWKTWWFAFSIISSLALLLGTIYYQRLQFLKRRAVILQNMVNERTKQIQLQREEIAAQNEELEAQTEKLGLINVELEKRVENRTKRLKELNDELIDQNTQLEQFAFITAHNIRGPVARIKGLVSLLKPDNLHELIIHLETSVTNLDEVIADLSTILNITHGVDKKLELVSVRNQLTLVLEMLENEIKLLKANVDISDFEDLEILGLKPYFQSIFYNLIHNSLKYADPAKNLVIKCYTQRVHDHYILVIEDNGIGIDMRYAKEKIFKLHQRFHTNTIGRGFGLYLVKTQVRAMRGKIEVESELTKGTRFVIEFPNIQVS